MSASPQRPAVLPLVLAVAVIGIGVSGPLARLADAPPLAIAAWRMLLACVAVTAVLLRTGTWREWATLRRRDFALAAISGLLLAVHFWSWIASLGLTSVAASVLLVNMHPLVIVLGGALWLGERPRRRQLLGLALALAGAIGVGVGTAADGAREITSTAGAWLAVLGAVTVGLYYLVGRALRARLSVWAYVGLVYGACLLALLGFAAATATPLWPYAPRTLALFAAIALGPMLLGHTGFNWALRYVPAYVVSLLLLIEPVVAAALAWWWFAERPAPLLWAGGAVVLAGLALASRTQDAASDSA